MFAFATEDMSAVETGQVFSVETGQMSAVEAGQMSAVETGTGVEVSGKELGPKSSKWPEMGREWSPGLENRPTSIARLFPSLWDRSRGPKSGPEPEKFTWYPATAISVGRIQNRRRHMKEDIVKL